MADDVTGKAKHVGGKIEEGLGELLGDREMQRDGKLSQQEGEAEQDAARAQEDLQDAAARKAAAERARNASKNRNV